MTQHSGLSAGRWSQFSLGQQVLAIGNEMHRAAKLIEKDDVEGLRKAYERVLRLVDLTVEVQAGHGLRRELLRWRDLVAGLYVSRSVDALAHAASLRTLLRMTPAAAQQIPFVLGSSGPD